VSPLGFYTNQFWDILRTVAEIGAKYLTSNDDEKLNTQES
jgi:hypothetical protein